MKPFLTVFIPAYDEAGNLPRCIQSVQAEMDSLGVSIEIIIVDDGSRDATPALIDELATQNDRLRAFHHPVNMGIGAAFKTALQHARGEWFILIPADLAMEPSELRRYITAAASADVVVGLRSDLSDYNLLRKFVHYTNIFLIRRLFNVPLHQFQYISMYRTEFLRSIEIKYWRSAFFLAEILIKAHALGYRFVEVEVLYAPRVTGRATGAKVKLIFTTIWDLFRFWLRWIRLGTKRVVR